MFPLDYDWKEQVIFWSDTYSESINWIKMDQNDQGMLIKGQFVTSVLGYLELYNLMSSCVIV